MKICEAKICLCPQTALAIAPCYRGERDERRTEPNTVRVHPASPPFALHVTRLFYTKMQNRYLGGVMGDPGNMGGSFASLEGYGPTFRMRTVRVEHRE